MMPTGAKGVGLYKACTLYKLAHALWTHLGMDGFHHVEELREIRTSEVRRRAKSGEQTAVGDFLEVLFTDVLYTNTTVSS